MFVLVCTCCLRGTRKANAQKSPRFCGAVGNEHTQRSQMNVFRGTGRRKTDLRFSRDALGSQQASLEGSQGEQQQKKQKKTQNSPKLSAHEPTILPPVLFPAHAHATTKHAYFTGMDTYTYNTLRVVVVVVRGRVIHARLSEESTKCSKAWAAFAKSTFECGRRDLIALREEWVRDTTRAWSGQVHISRRRF